MRVGVVTSVFWNLSTDSEKLWCQTSLECLKCTDEVSAAVFEILKPSDQQVSFIKTVGIIEYRKCFSNGSIPVLNHKYNQKLIN